MNNSAIKHYLKNLEQELDCPKTERNCFLQRFRTDVLAFADESTTIAILEQEFGTVQEVAAEFLTSLDAENLQLHKVNQRKRKKRMIILFVVVALVLLLTICIGFYFREQNGVFHVATYTRDLGEVPDSVVTDDDLRTWLEEHGVDFET